MGCEIVDMGNGGTAIVCSRGSRRQCAYCKASGTQLCDYPTGGGKTCDRAMCKTHSATKGAADYCRDHRERAGLGKHIPKHPEGEAHWIKAKFKGQCWNCAATIEEGERCLWFKEMRQIACEGCGEQD